MRKQLKRTKKIRRLQAKIAQFIEVCGGQQIVCGTKQGTVAIAYWQGKGTIRIPVALTAAHVVGGTAGINSAVVINGNAKGTVIQVLGDNDVAVIKLENAVSKLDVLDVLKNTPYTVFSLQAAPQEGPVFMLGSVSGRVEGEVIGIGVSVVVNDIFEPKSGKSLDAMIEISPVDKESFGVYGDSGSPLLQASENDGKFNVIGILVAVNDSKDQTKKGYGYAKRFDEFYGELNLNESK